MFTGRAITDDMFREGLRVHLSAEIACPDKIYTRSHMMMMMLNWLA